MSADPLSGFFALLTVCIRDDDGERSSTKLLAYTTLSFVGGILTSGLTAYLLGMVHLAP